MQGCICPHPPLLIPEVGGTARNKIAATVTAMERLAASVGEPETIVVISPHADDFGASHAVKTAPRLRGDFGRFRCPDAAFSYDNDVQFAELLLALAGDNRKLRLVPDDGEVLDWGVLVPLSFLRPDRIVSLSVVGPYAEHRTLGQLVRRCAEELGRDTLFLASGDLSHALIHGAPAPYDPRGKLFDDEVVSLLGVGDFPALMRIEPVLLDGAAECGLRSFVALGGFLGDDAMVDPEIFSYEGPYGVGYLVARFGPRPVRGGRRGMSERRARRRAGPGRLRVRLRALLRGRRPRARAARGRVLRAPGGVLRHPQEARRAARLHRHAGAGRGVAGLGDRPQRPLVGPARPALPAGDRRRVRGAHLLGGRARAPASRARSADLDPQRYGVIVEAGLAARRAAAGPRGRRHRRPAGEHRAARRRASPPDQAFDVRRFAVTRYRQGDAPAIATATDRLRRGG